ncbi:YiiX/YebB-like N1pC/P60 family cysteine hydrolase [Pseudomonas sp. LPH60]|uniref:YiiX/YebB-like N1pC/P60 family cysteine hydrolase n=1 Tax=Pseudomonas sp. LPH60 TaxID=3065906 RepID=UPI00273ADA27|nr:YiiX/YebB-like N1pC/P60 family cysteine hydrolase [Pseudomonas sp. LPH60]MDP4573353.1 YiiX/YebB-like N1pC/P60 family cysteine hydrolase [Pseudomonas sp. LPH60]
MDSLTRRPAQPASCCFLLDVSKLQVGDILLSRNDALQSNLIRSATGSGFSHAALFVHDGGVLIEAIKTGVKLSSMLGRAALTRASIKVLRLKEQIILDKARLASVAKSHVHKRYSLKGALLTQIATARAPTADEDRLFCSQLIASAFAQCGVPLSGQPAHLMTPGDLERSDLLVDVTDSVIIHSQVADLLSVSFIEQHQEQDLSDFFHQLNMNIATLTQQACPFIKPLKLRSLTDICVALKMGDMLFAPQQLDELAQAFSEAVGDRLEHFHLRFCSEHQGSFQQPQLMRLFIDDPRTTREQLLAQLDFLQHAVHAHRASIRVRRQQIEESRQLDLKLAGHPSFAIVRKVEDFFALALETEQALLQSASSGAELIRQHLSNSEAPSH